MRNLIRLPRLINDSFETWCYTRFFRARVKNSIYQRMCFLPTIMDYNTYLYKKEYLGDKVRGHVNNDPGVRRLHKLKPKTPLV